jgi:hypothetical protein
VAEAAREMNPVFDPHWSGAARLAAEGDDAPGRSSRRGGRRGARGSPPRDRRAANARRAAASRGPSAPSP